MTSSQSWNLEAQNGSPPAAPASIHAFSAVASANSCRPDLHLVKVAKTSVSMRPLVGSMPSLSSYIKFAEILLNEGALLIIALARLPLSNTSTARLRKLSDAYFDTSWSLCSLCRLTQTTSVLRCLEDGERFKCRSQLGSSLMQVI